MDSPSGEPLFLLDSTLEGVDEGENLVSAALQKSHLSEDSRHWVLLAVREVLVNAAQHGSRFDPAKKVFLRISNSARDLAVEVGDEGDGFNPEHVPDPKEEQNLDKQSGRGLLIARSFLDEVVIGRREPRGTLVRMLKRTPA